MTAVDWSGRLFLAVPLTEEVRAEIVRHLRAVWPGARLPGRVVPPVNWHLTLRFLGETSSTDAQRVVRELEARELGPSFALTFWELGAFPRADRARVLWLGLVEDDGRRQFDRLAQVVEGAVVVAGCAPESRPVAGHLTLSRLQPPLDLEATVLAAPPADVGLSVDRVVLYRSLLGQGPVRYEALWHRSLGG
jgi:2'-5' RNA ligase